MPGDRVLHVARGTTELTSGTGTIEGVARGLGAEARLQQTGKRKRLITARDG